MDSKPWWQSVGVWGSIVALAAAGLHALGFTVSAADQKALAENFVVAANAISTLAGLVGGAVALWGRIRATKVLTR